MASYLRMIESRFLVKPLPSSEQFDTKRRCWVCGSSLVQTGELSPCGTLYEVSCDSPHRCTSRWLEGVPA